MKLRSQAGDIVYHGSFIAHWIDKLVFYQAPSWVFILCYTLFGHWFWPVGTGYDHALLAEILKPGNLSAATCVKVPSPKYKRTGETTINQGLI